ncbi:nuclear transport factor 2 family protein [Sphingomonas jaspsi]|uniref:nuclear transport factor 2 family protein n=1 Tax=Sphingomonas jaspsi TaxID=392409 RepID=UPI0004AF8EA5|nr:nuclear transport factor 2 family protein [Sphingomonas jaspsi]
MNLAPPFEAFAHEWINAFNSHELDRIIALYADDVRLTSPLYLRYTAGASATVQGIEPLRSYFGSALQRYPDLRFTLLDVATGVDGPCIRYHSNVGDHVAMEAFSLDRERRIVRVWCHYV